MISEHDFDIREPILELRTVTAGYGDIVAIRNVSLKLPKAGILCLLGRNGSGKSTTLRSIVGLNRAMTGSVLLEGQDIAAKRVYDRAAAGIAFVQEGKRIFRDRTVEENLVLGAFTTGLRRRALAGKIDQSYELFPILGEKRNQRAGLLSGGQQQMLAIAQALMPDPKVLLLDEPSAGLAPSIVGDVLRVVRRLRDERGLSIVLVEQAADLALGVGDHVVVLDLGKVVFAGPTSAPGVRDKVVDAYFSLG